MSKITTHTYALKVDVITAEDGSRYWKASCVIGDQPYSCIGVSPEDARQGLINRIDRDYDSDFTPLESPAYYVRPMRERIKETAILVALFMVCAAAGFFMFWAINQIANN